MNSDYGIYGGTILQEFVCNCGFTGQIMITKEIAEQLKLKKSGKTTINYFAPYGKKQFELWDPIVVSLEDLDHQKSGKTLSHCYNMEPIVANEVILGLKGLELIDVGVNVKKQKTYKYEVGIMNTFK